MKLMFCRLCALEIGQMNDGADPDVEVGEPTPIDDTYIKPDGFESLENNHAAPNPLLILVPVGRLVHQLRRTLKSRSINAATLKIYDVHFQSIMDSYPDPFPINSATALDPHLLYAATALHMCKFMLFRQNLTPVSKVQDRQDAIVRCVQVATDTAHYVWRTTPAAQNQHAQAVHPADTSSTEWKSKIRHVIPSLVIKHWWRCVLILCLAGEHAPALTIIGAMAAINDNRKANMACGRNLSFVLDLMIQKCQSGRGSEMENDEELLAYASGDLQGSSYSAWAWAGSDSRNNSTGSANSPSRMSPPWETHTQESAVQPVMLTDEEEREWGGWAKIEDMVRHLQYVRANSTHPSTQRPSPHGSPEEQRPSVAHQYSLPQQQYQHRPQHHQSPYHQSYPSPSMQQRHSPPSHRNSYSQPVPAPGHTTSPQMAAPKPSSRMSIKDITM